jgi:hypothetical protein
LQINFSENVHGENTPPMCAIFYYEPTANWMDEIGAKTRKIWTYKDPGT